MQALAAGLAILGSEVGGISDVVQPGINGFLVSINNKAAFAERLTTMLDLEILAGMKRASRQLAGSFDLAILARRLEMILAESAAKFPKSR